MRNAEEDTEPAIEQLIDTPKAAKLLDIHPVTLAEMAREGRIPAVKIGRVWRFRPSSLQRWFDEQERQQKRST